jgi:hypothetical protein
MHAYRFFAFHPGCSFYFAAPLAGAIFYAGYTTTFMSFHFHKCRQA